MFIHLMYQFEVVRHGYPALYPNPQYSEHRYNGVGVYYKGHTGHGDDGRTGSRVVCDVSNRV